MNAPKVEKKEPVNEGTNRKTEKKGNINRKQRHKDRHLPMHLQAVVNVQIKRVQTAKQQKKRD